MDGGQSQEAQRQASTPEDREETDNWALWSPRSCWDATDYPDPDFGERVAAAYHRSRMREGFRERMYGRDARESHRGWTPSPVRRAYGQRLLQTAESFAQDSDGEELETAAIPEIYYEVLHDAERYMRSQPSPTLPPPPAHLSRVTYLKATTPPRREVSSANATSVCAGRVVAPNKKEEDSQSRSKISSPRSSPASACSPPSSWTSYADFASEDGNINITAGIATGIEMTGSGKGNPDVAAVQMGTGIKGARSEDGDDDLITGQVRTRVKRARSDDGSTESTAGQVRAGNKRARSATPNRFVCMPDEMRLARVTERCSTRPAALRKRTSSPVNCPKALKRRRLSTSLALSGEVQALSNDGVQLGKEKLST